MIRMPCYRQGKERYAYSFLAIDNPVTDYHKFIQGINTDYRNSMFEYSYDAEYFFNTLDKIINKSTV